MEDSSSSTPIVVHASPSTNICQARITGILVETHITDIADPLGNPSLCDPFFLSRVYNARRHGESWEHTFSQTRSQAGSGRDFSRMAPVLTDVRVALVEEEYRGGPAPGTCVAEHQMQNLAQVEELADSIELPASHIILEKGQIEDPALQMVMVRHASTLGICSSREAALLETLPWIPSSPLRHLLVADVVHFPDQFESILRIPLLEGLTVNIPADYTTYYQYMEQLCNKFTALGLRDGRVGSARGNTNDALERLVQALQNQTGKVKHLLLDNLVLYESSPHAVLQVELLSRLAAKGNLTRLALSFLIGNGLLPTTASQLESLLQAVFTSPSLSDLGLTLGSLVAFNLAWFMGAICNSRILEKLQVLRFFFDSHEGIEKSSNGLRMLVEGLTQPCCTVRFLDVSFSDCGSARSECKNLFYWLLKHSKSNMAFRALRVGTLLSTELLEEGCLANYLCSPACSLVWLECHIASFDTLFPASYKSAADEYGEWELANSLTNNFSICYLSFPWTNLEAKAHAASLIRRNMLYKSGQLLKEPQVKPDVVKLFICGHGGVGKSTLCRALLSRRTAATQLVPSAAGLFPSFQTDHRTRGMELHPLTMGKIGKLTVCDLGGQEEFHVLHHYFMHASDNDLFIVVCKFDEGLTRQDVFEQQLTYWLRFIVSHRSKVKISSDEYSSSAVKLPKVIVVVNFFGSSAPQSFQAMHDIAHDRTQSVLSRFSKALDFGSIEYGGSKSPTHNLFGVKVITVGQVIPVKKRLKALHEDFLRTALPIPKLCNEIAAHVLPPGRQLGLFASQQGADALLMTYSAILERCSTLFSDGCNHEDNEHRVKAALMVLHNYGLLVFFPKNVDNTKKEPGNTLVIIDSGWFCNKLIGTLLGTHLLKAPRSRKSSAWEWHVEDIKHLLRKQGCKGEHLEEVLRYLQELELCFPIQEKGSSSWLSFPALVNEQKYVQFPAVEKRQDVEPIFFGRRLKCKDSSIHLIPFGVFTRLQVRLQKLYGNESFQLGYGWTSFLKDNVGAVVRYGGDEAVESSCGSKQWIDIIVLCPNMRPDAGSSSGVSTVFAGRPYSSTKLGNEVMDMLKAVIYEIFQATDFGGLPAVMLQEFVLQNQTSDSHAVELSRVLGKVKEKGLEESYQEWHDSTSTPVLELLLPKELDTLKKDQFISLAQIEEEYSFGVYGTEGAKECVHGDGSESAEFSSIYKESKGKEHVESEDCGAGKLTEQNQELWRLIRGGMKMYDVRQEKRFACVNATLQDIRGDIQSLNKLLGQAVRDIIANCSTSLLRHELEKGAAHPLYPYLVDPIGKLKPLKELFRKQARLHFMCESRLEGPHVVEGQKGRQVTIKVKEWLAKAAKVMLPAFRVMCCVARIAATVYLPGPHVFIPSPDFLVSLGIEKDGLQHVILPKALEALLDQVDGVDYRRLLTQEGCKLQSNEVKDAIQGILKNMDIDMARDFALQRVYSGDQTFWVCEHHIGEGTPFKHIPNPFE